MPSTPSLFWEPAHAATRADNGRVALESPLPPVLQELNNAVVVHIRHDPLATPEQTVMDYLENHPEITNRVARELTGIRSENSMKEVFYRLRDSGVLEQVPGRSQARKAWRKKVIDGGPEQLSGQ
jgi:hypothetical protein